jgi:mono/diheme cytochrome c family protein
MNAKLLAAGVLLLAPALPLTAKAGEDDVKLKEGKGLEAVMQNCVACHSLDYIEMNSPFLDEKGWTAEVTKMVKAFGAPVDEADQKAIIEYLSANYGKR